MNNDELAGKLIAHPKTVRTASVTAIAILIGALVLWHYATKAPHRSAPAQVAASGSTKPDENRDGASALQKKIASAQIHLDDLKSSLDNLQKANPPPGGSEARAQDIDKRIVSVEARMNQIARVGRQTVGNAEAFQTGLQVQNADSRLAVEREIQEVDDTIASLQNQIAQVRTTPTTDFQTQGLQLQALETQIANQKTLRDQLTSQTRTVNEQAEAASAMARSELQAETEGLAAERRDLERELKDLRNEQETWKNREPAAHADDPARARKISELEQEISDQEVSLSQLRNRYMSVINKETQ